MKDAVDVLKNDVGRIEDVVVSTAEGGAVGVAVVIEIVDGDEALGAA